jgi:hypothetical protein
MGTFENWAGKVRLHTMTAAYGPDEAERLTVRSPLLVPELPDDLRDEGLLSRRRRDVGGGVRAKSDEAKARDTGITVERWRKLAR